MVGRRRASGVAEGGGGWRRVAEGGGRRAKRHTGGRGAYPYAARGGSPRYEIIYVAEGLFLGSCPSPAPAGSARSRIPVAAAAKSVAAAAVGINKKSPGRACSVTSCGRRDGRRRLISRRPISLVITELSERSFLPVARPCPPASA
ncbi:hypothetical protein KM043_003867 [Ampulex compressa]|nr:hypothetical protein KM043_003867 [Ampulex compressa]